MRCMRWILSAQRHSINARATHQSIFIILICKYHYIKLFLKRHGRVAPTCKQNMKKITLIIFLFMFILSACGGETTEAPTIEPTATSVPTVEPTAIPPTVEAVTPTIEPTEEPETFRFSPIDGMPQVYIPTGTFRMGGLDVRHGPDEVPAHDVTIDAFWMDQLEVTNAMYQLCVSDGVCTPPQNFASQRRNDYYENI